MYVAYQLMAEVGSALPQTYQQVLSEVLEVRRDDIKQALTDNVSNISHSTLTDFDWTTKVGNRWEPIMICW